MVKRSVSPIVDSSGHPFEYTEHSPDERMARGAVITNNYMTMHPDKYDISEDVKYKKAKSIHECTTLHDLVRLSKNDDAVDIQAKVMCLTTREARKKRKTVIEPAFDFQYMNKKQFITTFEKNKPYAKHRESVDSFLSDGAEFSNGFDLIGDDFIPLLGGPFNKQLYYYDYLKMHMIAFHALHHDPIAKRIINIMNQFTLGKGFRVDIDAGSNDKQKAQGVWEAFAKVNNIFRLMRYLNIELSTYGEVMPWKLPNNWTFQQYNVKPGQEVPLGLIPRYKLIDPSVVWEIVTYPEDIERQLYFQTVYPTQYQMYTGRDGGSDVPSTKFITQQIPAEQILHHKINCVSNEKRGRSDLFAILGFLKRMRDSVNYEMVSQQKNAAWSIDTTIEGSQADIQAYIDDQKRNGTYAPAGSEFVHSKKVERKYNANQGSKGGGSEAFNWNLSLIAVGAGIPISYFGSHLSGGSTRASALVATEPVAKVFEERQITLESVLKQMGEGLFEQFGVEASIEITFPEIITQDRSAKIKDIVTAEEAGYIKPERAAAMVAKELGITDYDFDQEQIDIKTSIQNGDPAARPLTDPALQSQTGSIGMSGVQFGDPSGSGQDGSPRKPSAVTGDEKHDLKQSGGF